jgi:NitT/TauT family transport system ATP-binding protein
MENNTIICNNINKSFGQKQVLSNFSAEFPKGTVTAIMGASGCGKTTLLRIIAGLEKADSGKISGVNKNKTAFLFQEDRLLSWLTAKQNVEAVIKDKSKKELAAEILSELGLGNDLDAYPSELSGGMCRRVAIARALAYDSDLLLLDEALRGLDEKNIENTVYVIKKYSGGKTVISVTHSLSSLEENAVQIIHL